MKSSCISVFLLLANLTAAHAATINFSDLPPGKLTVPGNYDSGGLGFQLTDPGPDNPEWPYAAYAAIDDVGPHLLVLANGSVFTLEVPADTTRASLSFYRPEGFLAINGESVSFSGLNGTSGMIGGVAYSTPTSPGIVLVELTGEIHGLEIITLAEQLSTTWINEITLVPEPSTCALAILGAAAILAFTRSKS